MCAFAPAFHLSARASVSFFNESEASLKSDTPNVKIDNGVTAALHSNFSSDHRLSDRTHWEVPPGVEPGIDEGGEERWLEG